MALSRLHQASDDTAGSSPKGPGNKGPGCLYVVATPIGNLGDLSARATATLKSVATIACEDTRVTGVLLQRFGITTPMLAYHDHNAERVRPQLLARLGNGESFALVSDAGTPLISDPGYKLVTDCVENGIAVVPIPGPSAPVTALMGAGLPTDRFYFGGFLPNKSKARREALSDVKTLKATLVFFESPHRLSETLADMASVYGAREASVCRELTKLHEEFKRGPLPDLAAHYAETDARGEIVIVIAGATEGETTPEVDVRAALVDALKTMSVRDAADAVAKSADVPRRDVYALALQLAKEKHD
jgi:16S rRNA (cytidine1402-2'-O)-methyltransferase